MTDLQIGLLSIVGILFLIYTGMHVSIALALLSFLGVWFIRDNFTIAGKLLALAAADGISKYAFGVVPLFVLMGMFISVSEIGGDMFQVANRLFGRIRGGLGVATVAANAVFAAVTGISIASAAVFTKVAVPEMTKPGVPAPVRRGRGDRVFGAGYAHPAQSSPDPFRRSHGNLHRRPVQGPASCRASCWLSVTPLLIVFMAYTAGRNTWAERVFRQRHPGK